MRLSVLTQTKVAGTVHTFQSPWSLINSTGKPHCSANWAPPRRKLWPLYWSAGNPRSARLWRNLQTNFAWVKGTGVPFSTYRKRGAGPSTEGQVKQRPNRAVEGQNSVFFNLGKGILRVRSRNWMTFDHRTVKTAPSLWNSTSDVHRLRSGSNDPMLCTNKLDFRKKE